MTSTPSAVDFGEKLLQTTNTFSLSLQSLGNVYINGSSDPDLIITAVKIVGENKAEFSASLPAETVLSPQETTSLNIRFNPTSEGLKIADLLVYHNNSLIPYRVPLYGIAKSSGTTVTVHKRINSGSSTATTINGKTWSADNQYAFDNLEPYTNIQLTQIAATDEDPLYLVEQSSNGDKKPFRYKIPLAKGNYVVRLHFAEIYWGAPGGGITGGAGSRVMSVNLENQLRQINFDVAQEVGTASAIIKNFPVTVTDDTLNINFSATVNRPFVSAIEVYSFDNTPPITLKQAVTSNAIIDDLASLKVYPNPLTQSFFIDFPNTYKGPVTLQIADIAGRVYEIGKPNLQGRTRMEINISKFNLKPGVYFLKIHSAERNVEIIKLLIK